MDLMDKLICPLDEWLTQRLITSWREQVWQNATRLVDLPDLGGSDAIKVEFDARSQQRATAILGRAGVSGLKVPLYVLIAQKEMSIQKQQDRFTTRNYP